MAKEKDTAVETTAKNKMVKIKLFKDNYKYKDDVFVAVNGKAWQIQRGKEVEVPEEVAQVLEQSIKQDDDTANLIERKSAESKEALAQM